MHARELVELAATLSAQGPLLVRGTTTLSGQGMQQYWLASKCRLDRWTRDLRSLASGEPPTDAAALRMHRMFVRGVLEEILTGEVLTRVWSAVLCLYDQRRGGNEFGSLGRSILVGHMEARHRVLTLLVQRSGIDAKRAWKLNHLRRRAERWTDLLLGHLVPLGDVGEFAIDAERAIEFSRDLDYQSDATSGRQAWPLLRASLRAAFQRGMAPVSPNEDLNAEIGSAVVSCFPAEVLDATGLYRSLWLHRMANVARDVEGMIETLVG